MYIIAIDLGGTIIKLGLVKYGGDVLEMKCLPVQSINGLAVLLPSLEKSINELLDTYGITKASLLGIGLAFPGLVDPHEGRVISTNEKYNDACLLDLNEWVRQAWQVPFFMDNDARLATVGEWKCGAAKGYDSVVMMTIGTGIGTGVIMEGNIVRGIHYQAGSLGGHFVIDYKGRMCSCGNRGCVEAMASSFFLPRIIEESNYLPESFKLQARMGKMDFKEVFTLAKEGSAEARMLCEECMDVWSAAIISYIHAYDPQVVVLGGGIMKSHEIIIPYLKDRINRLAWCPTEKVELVTSGLGDKAALLGLEYCLLNEKNKLTDEKILK